MKKLILVSLLIVALLLSAVGGLAFAQTPDKAQGHAPDQILVKFLPGTPENAQAEVHKRHGSKVVDVIAGIDVQVVRIPENKVKEKVKGYKGEASVEFAEPDFIAEAILTPNDPYFGNQWGMVKIQASEAWDITTGSSAVKIAICDTGIDQNHEDLATKIVANKNFTTSLTVDDKYGHGTHVAGIAAAITNNGKGVAGVGFNSSLMNAKVLGDTGTGYYSWIANGIIWAADNGAKVINLSLGGTSASSTLESAVNYAWGRGSVLVAAAGNNNTNAPLYPAYYASCIAVAATDQNDDKASFSNYGAWVDIAAPGVSIFSTLPNHTNRIGILNYGSLSGTSMSTPHVGGVAALAFAKYPASSNADIRTRIENSEDPTTGFTTTGIGRVNAFKAVQPADAPPQVSIVNPVNGATVAGSVLIQVSATDDKGVSSVEYSIDSGAYQAMSYSSTSGYWEANWDGTTVADGSHTIKAKATDTIGQIAIVSITVTVDNVDEPPTVSIISPGEGAFVSGTITIQASASDDKGVGKVEFYVDGVLLAADDLAPYECSWNTTTVTDGSHSIKAVATDTANQSTSDAATVTVDNTVPVVEVVEPAEGAVVSGPITIKASVTEANIDEVEYQVDTGSFAPMTYNEASGYWEANWDSNTVANGAHTVTVRAVDKAGNSGSDANNFTVENPVAAEFYDSFEDGTLNNWVQDAQNDWFVSTQRATDGKYSAEVDGAAVDAALTLKAGINLSGKTQVSVKCDMLIEPGLDSGEYLTLEAVDKNGNWVELARLDGNVSSENVWHHVSKTLTGDFLFDSFKIRFKAKMSLPTEDANVDSVKVVWQ